MKEKAYRVEFTLAKELHEIPETDENFYYRRELTPRDQYSDGNNSYHNTPITPEVAHVKNSARYQQPGSGIFGTISSSINSEGDHHKIK